MQKIEAVIQPSKLDAVKDALVEIEVIARDPRGRYGTA